MAKRLGTTPDKVQRHVVDAIYWPDRYMDYQEWPWWRFDDPKSLLRAAPGGAVLRPSS